MAGTVTSHAADFRSINDAAAVLYDAPSAKAKKVYVVNRGYPVELVVTVEGWAKVRDARGDLTWVELKSLSEKRTVMIKAPMAVVRQSANDQAPVVFQARQQVVLELVEVERGWAHVRHADGGAGYVRVDLVWGA
jgi:SH3-like domain-containing protein